MRFVPADGLADEGHVAVALAVDGEPGRVRHVAPAPHRGVGGEDVAVGADDRHLEHHARRQQALGAHRAQGCAGTVHLDRVLQHAQGLVDAGQAARHLRFVGVDQLAGGFRRRLACGGFLLAHHVQGRQPQGRDQQQGEQRQGDVGLEPAAEQAHHGRAPRVRGRGGGRGLALRAVHGQRSTSTGRTLASSAARSI